MQTADNVARWFLRQNAGFVLDGTGDYITPQKLQKLLYFAQGSYLALYDEPLFEDEIEAWRCGAAVYTIYKKYPGEDGIKSFSPPEDNFTPEEYFVMEMVAEEFGQLAAWKLSEMSLEDISDMGTVKNDVIDLADLKTHFRENYFPDDEFDD